MELQKQPKQLNYQDTQITSILPTKSPISFRSTTKQTENYKYQTDEHPKILALFYRTAQSKDQAS